MAYASAHDQPGKYEFDDIYDAPDPRPYFCELARHDYRIPAAAQPVFTRLVEARRVPGEQVTVTDLCCSYGINAALLKHDLTFDDLYGRYCSEDLAGASGDTLTELDTSFYRRHRRPGAPRVVGLDAAAKAIAYATRVGLLDSGWSDDLEQDGPSGPLAEAIASTDLVTVTGGVGYIGPRTFDAVLSRVRTPDPWVGVFALRWVDFEPIAEVLAHHGLVTERLSTRTFAQRNFVDDAEREYVLRTLTEGGIDPQGKESEGGYHAYFYLARPKDEVADCPLEDWFDAAAQPRCG